MSKLGVVLIIAVLFLTASQLITADFSRDKRVHHAVRLRDIMRNFRGTRACAEFGHSCISATCCPGVTCVEIDEPVCLWD
uniref:Conotoxin Bt6.1 n=1 Tax=Conus betulinus TaxID=89764 RepID=M9PMU2_CONBE|nr:conotoxin Bt6.1 [Conus betulinus]